MRIQTSHWINNAAHGQDNYLIRRTRQAVLLAVCDGVSSAKQGAVASQSFVDALKTCILDPQSVRDIIQDTHMRLWEEHNGEAQSTLVCALCTKNTIELFWVGDSPAYILRDERAEQLNAFDQDAENPSVLTQVLGYDPCAIHQLSYTMKHNDALILCSDGISDNVSEEDFSHSKRAAPRTTIRAIRNVLEQRAKQGSGDVYGEYVDDDQTCVVAHYSQEN